MTKKKEKGELESQPLKETDAKTIVSAEKFFTLRKKPGGYYSKVELSLFHTDDGGVIFDVDEGPEDILEISHEKASMGMLHQAIGGKVT